MTEVEHSRTEIGGYVCPTCRLVFAAHVSQLGEDLRCPGCQHLVKIPRDGEEEQKLRPRKSKRYVQAGNAAGVSSSSFRGDRRKPDWERGSHAVPDKKQGGNTLPWMWILPAGVIGLGLFAFMLMMVFNAKPVEPVEVDDADLSVKPDLVQVQEVTPEKKEEFDPSVHGEKLEQAIAKFLQASSTDELLSVVRRTPGIEERMKSYYSQHEMEKRDFKSLVNSASLLDKPDVIIFEIRLSDYSAKQGYAQLIDGEIYVDWETFVVYSELPWDKLVAEKPTKAVTVRAISNPSSYYNFDFVDEKWAAFDLSSPVEDMAFVGYVPKNSALHAKLSPIGSDGRMEVTLKVRYPENAVSSNQIIIEEVVETKWMIDELEPQK